MSASNRTELTLSIDPKNLSKTDEFILGYFLEYARNNELNFIIPDTYAYPLLDREKLQQISVSQPRFISLTNQLTYRVCSSESTHHHYDVYSGVIIGGIKLQTGVFGNIEEIVGVLKWRDDGSVFYIGDKNRIGKIQDLRADTKEAKLALISLVHDEAKLMLRMPVLHSKHVTFFHNHSATQKTADEPNKSVIVMGKLPGEDLDKFLKKDALDKANKINLYTTDRRLQLCLSVLK
jgi:hypothetical protein